MVCENCKTELIPFMDYGKIPLGNKFLRAGEEAAEKKYHLQLAWCPKCSLVQQTHPPPTSDLEADYRNYHYVPVGASLTSNLRKLGYDIFQRCKLTSKSLVLDVGSNDGTLLSALRPHCEILGIEPAHEIGEAARERGIPTIESFFNKNIAHALDGRVSVVVMTQTLQHLPELRQILKAVYEILQADGWFIVEGRYFTDALRLNEYDTAYPEMLYYFSFAALANLLWEQGFIIRWTEKVPVYGGSLRVWAHKGKREPLNDEGIRIFENEQKQGLNHEQTYVTWGKRCHDLKTQLQQILPHQDISAYGAPSTGTTLMNWLQPNGFEYIIDDNPLKQGLLQPGTHIPIMPLSHYQAHPTGTVLLLAWRLQAEIQSKIHSKIIIPLPEVRTLGP